MGPGNEAGLWPGNEAGVGAGNEAGLWPGNEAGMWPGNEAGVGLAGYRYCCNQVLLFCLSCRSEIVFPT